MSPEPAGASFLLHKPAIYWPAGGQLVDVSAPSDFSRGALRGLISEVLAAMTLPRVTCARQTAPAGRCLPEAANAGIIRSPLSAAEEVCSAWLKW
jgi:hypothetical protein